MSEQADTIRAVWERHADEDYRRDQSHWRGCGRWADDEEWQALGRKSRLQIHRIIRYLNLLKYWDEPRTFLEWGPGGGAHLFELSKLATTYYGVDISQKNLDEARRMIGVEGYAGFRPILIEDDLSVVRAAVAEPVDVFLSCAVFQHFPSKAYGLEVLDCLASVAKPHGIGFIQFRFDNGKERYRPIETLQDYAEHHITANSYGIDEFTVAAGKHGFDPLFVNDIRPVNNYATLALRRSAR